MNLEASVSQRLWQTRFNLFFASRVMKVLADNFASVAFIWLLLESGGGAVATSILFFVALIPEMLFGLFVSPLLARGRLTAWMFASDAIRALIVLMIAICYFQGFTPTWLFFAAGFIQSACGSVYNPASVALLPRLVDKTHVQQANALLAGSNQIVYLIGLAGAGALVTLLSSATTLLVTCGVFLLSALLVLMVRPRAIAEQEAPVAQESEEADKQGKLKGYWQDVRANFTILRKHRVIFFINFFALFLNIGMAPFLSLMAVFVTEELHGNAATLSLLRGSLMLGALLMGLVLSKITVKRYFTLFLVAGLMQGVALTLFGFTSWTWVIALCCMLIGVVETAINVPEMVLIQTTVPPHEQPAIYAAGTALATCCLPFAALVVGPLAEHFGTGIIIASGGALILLAGILMRFLMPIAQLNTADKDQSAISH